MPTNTSPHIINKSKSKKESTHRRYQIKLNKNNEIKRVINKHYILCITYNTIVYVLNE